MSNIPAWLLREDDGDDFTSRLLQSTGDTATSEDIARAYREYRIEYKRWYWHQNSKARPETVRAIARKGQAKYRKAHPEKVRARSMRYRVRDIDGSGQITAEDIRKQYKSQKGLCWWCSISVEGNYHVDHVIPLKRGGRNTPGNTVISCPPCNTRKRDKLPHEWIGRLL